MLIVRCEIKRLRKLLAAANPNCITCKQADAINKSIKAVGLALFGLGRPPLDSLFRTVSHEWKGWGIEEDISVSCNHCKYRFDCAAKAPCSNLVVDEKFLISILGDRNGQKTKKTTLL